MPRYNTTDKQPPIFPCDVLDADGNVCGVEIVEFDTDSGEVVEYLLGEDGQPQEALLPPDGDRSKQILFSDLPQGQLKDRDGERTVPIRPLDKKDWVVGPATKTIQHRPPLRIVPIEEPALA